MPADDVDKYLAAVRDDARAALEKLRRDIRAAAPDAEERIAYRMPAYRQKRMVVAFAAATNHCSFFVMSPAVMATHKGELKSYDTAKGTVRFPAKKPLPAALVRKLVKARLAENAALDAARQAKTKLARKKRATRSGK